MAAREISEDGHIVDSAKPLRGAVICCTAVPEEQRASIEELAGQMGGSYRANLTLEVTHLIVADHKTPKYKYVAKERGDIRPMRLEWIEAVRQLWMQDAKFDMEVLERQYALPALHKLRISMTGCDDLERQELAEQATAHGASYEGDLTKQITHLISFRTEGAKYKAARSWGLHVVSPEWLRDTLERGMILEEALYDPVLPLEERGVGAWDRSRQPGRSILGKRSRDDDGSGDHVKRKLRRTASTKLNSQNADVWGGILGGGPQPRAAKTEASGQAATERDHDLPEAARDSFRADDGGSMKYSVKRGLFASCRFHLYGFDDRRSRILQSHLQCHDAIIDSTIQQLEAADEEYLFVLVPNDMPVDKRLEIPSGRIELITEWWVERCLYHKHFSPPSAHVIGRPLPSLPLTGFKDMRITSSAFSGIDLLHVGRVIELIGATYCEDFTAQTAVLVTKVITGLRKDKLLHAQRWNIPVVHAGWLWDSIAAGRRLPFDKYRLRQAKNPELKPIESRVVEQLPLEGHDEDHGQSRAQDLTNNTRTTLENEDGVPLEVARASRKVAINADTSEVGPTEATMPLSASASMHRPASKSGPLHEICPNPTSKSASPEKPTTVPPVPNLERLPTPSQQHQIDDAITALLAANRQKTGASTITSAAGAVPRKRENRIRGRVLSNVSASGVLSRATSVESNAMGETNVGDTTTGPARRDCSTADTTRALMPKQHESSKSNGNGPCLDDFMQDQHYHHRRHHHLDASTTAEEPPPTQVTYADPQSDVQRARVMAKMRGEEPVEGVLDKTGHGAGARLAREQAGLGIVGGGTVGRPVVDLCETGAAGRRRGRSTRSGKVGGN